MDEPVAPQTPPAPVTPEKSGGFFQNLIDVYFVPREAFTRIVRNPGWLLPVAGYLIVVLAFTGIWSSRMDPREFMKTQLEESGQMEKIPAERREAVLDQQARMMPIFLWVFPLIGVVVVLLVVGGGLMFIYRFFYASEVTFKQALAISAWSFFAVALVTTPLLLVVMGMKGDWNLNPQDVLQANLALLLDKSTAAKPLWTFMSSIDLFSFWTIFLLASGFAVASRKSTGSALWGIVIPWALIVLAKVGWAAIF
jgi:hypothetical protein